jgi:hypothetical protein
VGRLIRIGMCRRSTCCLCRIFKLERTDGEAHTRARVLPSGRRAECVCPSSVEQMAEMLLAKDRDVIEAAPPDRSD